MLYEDTDNFRRRKDFPGRRFSTLCRTPVRAKEPSSAAMPCFGGERQYAMEMAAVIAAGTNFMNSWPVHLCGHRTHGFEAINRS